MDAKIRFYIYNSLFFIDLHSFSFRLDFIRAGELFALLWVEP